MFSGTMLARHAAVVLVLCCVPLSGQQKAAPASPGALEFPVVMKQGVTAGATAVGTKVQAKLTAATLVNGTVFPVNAVFSGEVTESVAKSATSPSRLAIRIDSVQWKNGSAPVNLYLTAWYYPLTVDMGEGMLYSPPDASNNPKTLSGAGSYNPSNPTPRQSFPGSDSDRNADSMPGTPHLAASNHRVPMKNAESTRNDDGTVTITCKNSNIKLDKQTTYVLAPADSPSQSK